MLVKSDVFYYWCFTCNESMGWTYDQGEMTEEESRKSQKGDYDYPCPKCGGILVVECG